MSHCIEKYLNSIRKDQEMNWDTGEEIQFWRFFGDGGGDWEESSKLTTKECLENYIKHCHEQISFAEACLKDKQVFKEE